MTIPREPINPSNFSFKLEDLLTCALESSDPHAHAHTHTHIHTCTYTHAHAHAYAHMHMHIHTNTHPHYRTHTHTHRCAHTYAPQHNYTYIKAYTSRAMQSVSFSLLVAFALTPSMVSLSHQSALLTPSLLFLTLLRSFAFSHSGSLALSLAWFTPVLSPTQTRKRNLAERGGERKVCDGAGSICVVVTLALIVSVVCVVVTCINRHLCCVDTCINRHSCFNSSTHVTVASTRQLMSQLHKLVNSCHSCINSSTHVTVASTRQLMSQLHQLVNSCHSCFDS